MQLANLQRFDYNFSPFWCSCCIWQRQLPWRKTIINLCL